MNDGGVGIDREKSGQCDYDAAVIESVQIKTILNSAIETPKKYI